MTPRWIFAKFEAHTEQLSTNMRTKTALLTAALVAAGVASSMAQNVYSVNVVGYVNLSVVPGFNLISLPLQNADATSSINSVLTNTSVNVPFGAFVSTWNPTNQQFNQAVYAGGDGHWYDGQFINLVSNSLVPGQGFFLFMPAVVNGGVSNMNITVVGSVLAGTNSYPVSKGFGFYGDYLPIVGDLTTNGFPVTDNSFLNTFSNGIGYNQAVYGLDTTHSSYNTNTGALLGGPATYPVFADGNFITRQLVAPKPGQGFLYSYLSPTNAVWTQVFNVGP